MKLSDKQVQALRAIDTGGVLAFYRSGNLLGYMNDNGPGFSEATVRSLRNRGLVEDTDSPVLTEAGRTLLLSWEPQ